MPSATDTLARSYLDLRWNFDPAAGTAAGDAASDARLGTFDDVSVRRQLAAYRAMAGAVEELEIAGLQDEIDRTALLDDIRVSTFRFQHERPHVHDPAFWLSHLFGAYYGLIERAADETERRAAAALARLQATPDFLASAGATLRSQPPVMLGTGLTMLEGGADLPGLLAAEFGRRVPSMNDALAAAAHEAAAALAHFKTTLRTELQTNPAELSFAVGEDEFNRRLHHEHALRATAPELWRYGLRLVEETGAEMQAAALALSPGAPWAETVRRLRTEGLGVSVLEAYADEVGRARGFVAESGIVELPSSELRVEATPAYLQHFLPAVWCEPSSPAERARGGRLLISDANGGAVHSRYETWAWAAAEVWPGHFLQRETAAAQPSLVRQYLWTPLTVRGWALYSEELLAAAGFAGGPEERLMGIARRLRAGVRVILDIGLHTRGMTPTEGVSYAVEHLAVDREEAMEMVRRASARPTYALADAVGRREIHRLRDAWRERVGPDAPLRQFHDAMLSYGGLPVSLIRWGMGLDD
ncbi:MAG TPA: DUF885 family protein [Gemmatimonadales bacterium]|nr:DUF885 family protein [Gemmatimonadales bacterium]